MCSKCQHAASAKSTPHTQCHVSLPALLIAIAMLIVALADRWLQLNIFPKGAIETSWYLVAFCCVAWPVFWNTFFEISKGVVFSEYTLMSIAAIGALLIGEYAEAVGLMALYGLGEMLQERAVEKARSNIRALLTLKPTFVRVVGSSQDHQEPVASVMPGTEISVPVGERVPLDSILISPSATLDTSAITGESEPRTYQQGEEIMAGMIVCNANIRLCTVRPESTSALSRIIALVEEAQERKAPNELLIRRFARLYTPIVVGIAFILAVAPPVLRMMGGPDLHITLFQALVFLVISCPCALVISIPLAYFRAIGLASRKGILFKGSAPLDSLCNTDYIVFDKTGTLTSGQFTVTRTTLSAEDLQTLASMESGSNHPIAKGIVAFAKSTGIIPTNDLSITEVAGIGIQATINHDIVQAGNTKMLDKCNIDISTYPAPYDYETAVHLIINNAYRGFIALSDEPNKHSLNAIKILRRMGLVNIAILSGDRQSIVNNIGRQLGITQCHGDLMPSQKAQFIAKLHQQGRQVAFIGDGINDTPAMAESQVAFAIGTGGSDIAVETADIVLHGNNPQHVSTAISLARTVKRVIIFNICLALAFKGIIMVADLLGYASMWLAIIADSGVALLCIALTTLIGAKAKSHRG